MYTTVHQVSIITHLRIDAALKKVPDSETDIVQKNLYINNNPYLFPFQFSKQRLRQTTD